MIQNSQNSSKSGLMQRERGWTCYKLCRSASSILLASDSIKLVATDLSLSANFALYFSSESKVGNQKLRKRSPVHIDLSHPLFAPTPTPTNMPPSRRAIFMETQSPIPTHHCFRCNKPAASCCAGCKDAPAHIQMDTYYCSTDCQRASWRDGHRDICRMLHTTRMLYRAGAFIQEIFYNYRERVFDHNIVKVEAKDKKLYLHDTELGSKTAELTRLSLSDFVFPFPAHLCKTVADRRGIASYLSCSDALAWMHKVIKYMLKGWSILEPSYLRSF